jgi:uncharacterized protein
MTRRQSEEERCGEHAKFLRIGAAFRAGDLEALRAAVDDAAAIPNGIIHPVIRSCLEYAIYHSPLPFIRTLLELGAHPVPPESDHAGFPPLIAALSCSRAVAGAVRRTDTVEMLELLLAHGADPHQRGINDYTALHMAVDVGHASAMEVLLADGADPNLRTRIDEFETPREMAEHLGRADLVERLKVAERRLS